ncbi:hypothetical protein K5V21_16970 [Clostridium sardiniense]|uniref:Uncharacterized protein n=1 Tax=Clostridium sardiniense TaxID=29369 RepID=A0ABS7L221_CLOSR|nr:hypothetical protein [Clostridium sardiniense]MBY0757126.1 hypothetical protein [Clostridium sardiniense]MDQ0461416.1 cytochrome b561 [Clostridium sardiniense]
MKKKLLPFQKRNLLFFFVGLILISCSLYFIYYSTTNNYLFGFNNKYLKDIAKNLATFAEICFFLVIELFILRSIIKSLNSNCLKILNSFLNKFKLDIPQEKQYKFLKSDILKKTKSFIIFISKIFQKFHVPIAVLAVSIILIHAYIFLHLGFKWTIGYILGILALTDLILMLITGMFRIFNKVIHVHKVLGIIFIILMCLHIALV